MSSVGPGAVGTSLARLMDQPPDIVLLFTDVVMPDVNGRRLADEATRRRPGLKVLFTTGYSRNAVVRDGVLDTGVQLLHKPFTLDELAAKVRAVLEDRAAAALPAPLSPSVPDPPKTVRPALPARA